MRRLSWIACQFGAERACKVQAEEEEEEKKCVEQKVVEERQREIARRLEMMGYYFDAYTGGINDWRAIDSGNVRNGVHLHDSSDNRDDRGGG